MRAKDIMTTPVITVKPSAALKEVAQVLIDRGISAVPVVDDAENLVGIVSEADLVALQAVLDPRRHVLPDFNGDERVLPHLASEAMTTDVVTVAEDEDVTQVARMMLDRGLKRVPVVSGTRVVGIISRRDILKVLARSDASIQAELQQRLDDEVAVVGRIHASVSDGRVTLTGREDEQARRLATIIARSIPGVVSVRFSDR